MRPFLELVLALLALPWIVLFFSFMMTIGHWENVQYRKPTLFLSIALLVIGVLRLLLEGGVE